MHIRRPRQDGQKRTVSHPLGCLFGGRGLVRGGLAGLMVIMGVGTMMWAGLGQSATLVSAPVKAGSVSELSLPDWRIQFEGLSSVLPPFVVRSPTDPKNLVSPPAPTLVPSFGNLPLSFERNDGQTDPSVRYLARGGGYTLFLTESEAILSLRSRGKAKGEIRSEKQGGKSESNTSSTSISKGRHEPKAGDEKSKAALKGGGTAGDISSLPVEFPPSVIRMKFAGANQAPKVQGNEKLPGIVNYFIGDDPTKWRTNIPTYKKIQYDNLYEGIDLVYYGNNEGKLEYDFIVASGADPKQIKLAFEGADAIRISETGDLVLMIDGREAYLQKPIVYQVNEAGNKIMIAGNYLLEKARSLGHQVTIQLAAFDGTKPLIIDPILFFSTYIGGSGRDSAFGIRTDAAGDVYMAGFTNSPDFPTVGSLQGALGGSFDALVLKLSRSGSSIVYATYLGGSGLENAEDIAVDKEGSAYVIGQTNSTNFPLAAPFQALYGGDPRDAFAVKLSPTGSSLVYSTYLGGSGTDWGTGVAIDLSGSAYVLGYTSSNNFPLMNAFQTTYAGGVHDLFVTKFSHNGLSLQYSTYIGGSGNDVARKIAVDADGSAYITGSTGSGNFPTVNPFQATHGGSGSDVVVTKLAPSGSALSYSTYLGGTGNDGVSGIALDATGSAYVAGSTNSSNFPVLNPLQGLYGGGINDAFVTKLTPQGNALAYSTYLGGSGDDQAFALSVDGFGQASVSGTTASINFPVVSALQATFGGGSNDSFVAKLSSTGANLLYSSYFGGSGSDLGWGLAVDSGGNIHIAGETDSIDLPLFDPLQVTFAGGTGDAFVAKICDDPLGPTPGTWIPTASLAAGRELHTATILPNGRILIAGGDRGSAPGDVFNSTELYDPSAKTFTAGNLMASPRLGHTATLLSTGTVLVAGGHNGTAILNTAELFDHDTGSISGTGNLTDIRYFHTATLLTNGNVLLAGGRSGSISSAHASAELYDPIFGTFAATASMSTTRYGHTATLLPNGKVLIAGGFNGTNSLASVELYDPVAETFVATGSLTNARSSHRAVLLSNGKVLIVGGSSTFTGGALTTAEIYDPATGTFNTTGSMATARSNAATILLANGNVLVAGGFDAASGAATTAEIYNVATGAFTQTGHLSIGRARHHLNLLPNGQVLVTGGTDFAGSFFASAELYTPQLCSAESDLSVTVVDNPDPVTLGETLVYQIDVTNNGPEDAANVVVTKSLPPDTVFNGGASSGSCSESIPGEVTCTVGPITSGAMVMVNIAVTVNGTPRIFSDSIEVMHLSEFDPDFGNNTVETTTTLTAVTNQAPIAIPPAVQPIVTAEDTFVDLFLEGEDPDSEPGSLTFTFSSPSKGVLSFPGGFNSLCSVGRDPDCLSAPRYTPNPGETGPDSFTFTVTDEGDPPLTSTPATVLITITSENDAPVAGDDAASVAEDPATPLVLNVLVNDTDPDNLVAPFNAGLVVTAAGPAASGGAVTVINAGAQVQYTPPPNFNGPDTFPYTVSDGSLSDTGQVTVTVTAVPDPPMLETALPVLTTTEDAPVQTVPLGGHFGDVDSGDTLTLTVANNTNPALVTGSVAGTTLTLIYQPNQAGTATLTIRATDSQSLFVEAPLTLTVGALNDPPTVAVPLADQTAEENDPPLQLNLSTTFTDVDIASSGDSLTLSVIGNTNPTLVTPSLAGTTLTLTLGANQAGTSTITVQARDEAGAMAADSFVLTVNDNVPAGPHDLVFEVRNSQEALLDPATWLPVAGEVLTVRAVVRQNGQPLADQPAVTFLVPSTWAPEGFQAAANPTVTPGAYTNDPDQTASADMATAALGTNQLQVTVQDYGGRVHLEATSALFDDGSGTPIFRQGVLTLPRDDDFDGLADAWEEQYGGIGLLTGATDTDPSPDPGEGVGAATPGDGLTAQEEYRGWRWGSALVPVGTVGNTEVYQTAAYVPDPAAMLTAGSYHPPHRRGNPLRKDLFLKVTRFDFWPLYTEPTCDCPFALGGAFAAMQVDVHVRSTNVPEAANVVSDQFLDFVHVVNRDLVNGFANRLGQDGLTIRNGPRTYFWAEKGRSCLGNGVDYAWDSCGAEKYTETYQIALDHYFGDRPYTDGDTYVGDPLDGQTAGPANGVLDPTTRVRDPNNLNVVNTTDAVVVLSGTPTAAQCTSGTVVDAGDHAFANKQCYDRQRTAVDINSNAKVELGQGQVEEPAQVQAGFESTRAQVLKSTITHETGHAVGMTHYNGITGCLMNSNSTSWRNDDRFCAASQGRLAIHND